MQVPLRVVEQRDVVILVNVPGLRDLFERTIVPLGGLIALHVEGARYTFNDGYQACLRLTGPRSDVALSMYLVITFVIVVGSTTELRHWDGDLPFPRRCEVKCVLPPEQPRRT